MTSIIEYLVLYFNGRRRTPRINFFPAFILVWIFIIAISFGLYKYSCSYFDGYASYMQNYWPDGFYEDEAYDVLYVMKEMEPELYKQKKVFSLLCISYLYWIVVNIFPMLNLIKRRLHDVGKSAWWILTPAWLVFIFFDSEIWDNQWGPAVESEDPDEEL